MKKIKLISAFLLWASASATYADATGHQHNESDTDTSDIAIHRHMTDMQLMMDNMEKTLSKKDKAELYEKHYDELKKHMAMMKASSANEHCIKMKEQSQDGLKKCVQHLNTRMDMMYLLVEQSLKSSHVEHTLDDSVGE
jgi:hypothetical protein